MRMLKLISGAKVVNTGQESKLFLNRFHHHFLKGYPNSTLNLGIFYLLF